MEAWPKVITFDCYGTLVQWPETLRRVFAGLLPAGADVAAFHQRFSDEHAKLRAGPYQGYIELLRAALVAALKGAGIEPPADAGDRLVAAVLRIDPYPDVPPVLARLDQDKHRLAIISNTEDALIADTVRGLGVPFIVISAEAAGAFKPDRRLFDYAFEQLEVKPREVLHVGAGFPTDMAPAYDMGVARVWVNRQGEKGDPDKPPSREIPDLGGLPFCVEELRAERAPRAG